MKLFRNEALSMNDIDFSKCETLNGDYIEIATARPELLEKYISYFETYIQKYPKHINCDIWKHYILVLEDAITAQS